MSKHPGVLRAALSCVRLKSNPRCGRNSGIRNTDPDWILAGHHRVARVLLFFARDYTLVVMNGLSYTCVLIAADKTRKM